MESASSHRPDELGDREKRFLARLSEKYESDQAKVPVRSYLIAGAVIVALFALSRWIPWWWAAIVVVEVIGLTLFHQYKRFGRFKTRLLIRLWRNLSEAHQEGN